MFPRRSYLLDNPQAGAQVPAPARDGNLPLSLQHFSKQAFLRR